MSTVTAVSPLAELATRALEASANRPAWLAARRCGITATEVKLLAKGGARARMELVQAKKSGEAVDLSGNQYVRRGNEREPFIADWIQRRFGIAPNDVLFAGFTNARYLATPDGVGVDEQGVLILSEIKTSKHDLDPSKKGSHYYSNGYDLQVQWQMEVAGASRVLFVWEQHDDNWPNPQPLELEPRFQWIERDEEVIAMLRAAADLALDEMDADAEGTATAPLELTEDEGMLIADLLAGRDGESKAKAVKERAWAALNELYASRESFALDSPLAKVTWSKEPDSTNEVPDVQAAKDADPELVKELEALSKRWNEHAAKFKKTVPVPGKSKLTITAIKPGKETKQ